MSFRLTGLDPTPFRPLFALPDTELAARGIERHRADTQPGFPDRVTLTDAAPGETLLLLNYLHQPGNTPYRASHAIFVREGAGERFDAVDQIPPALAIRLLSVRAFAVDDQMIDADVVEGRDLASTIERLFTNQDVAYLQIHFAKRGCYAARADRVAA